MITSNASQWVVYFPSDGYFRSVKKDRRLPDNTPTFTNKLENARIYKKKAHAAASMREYELNNYGRGPRILEVKLVIDDNQILMEELK